MKKLLLISLLICYARLASAQQFNYQWAFDIGVDNISENSFSIATDSKDNIYLIGHIESATDFDPDESTAMVGFAGEMYEPNFVLAKYSPNKEFVWARIVSCKYISDTAQDFDNQSFRIAIDGEDNVYVVGNFCGNVDFDPSENEFFLSNKTEYFRYFLAKYGSNGEFLGAKTIGGSDDLQIYFGTLSINIYNNNDVAVAGSFKNSLDFDPSRPEFAASSEVWHTFFARYSPNLDFISAKTMEAYRTFSSKIDKQDNIYIAGYFNGTTDFDPDATTHNVESTSNMDSYLAKYNSDGTFQWALTPSASGSDDYANRLAIDSLGNAYLIGSFNTSIKFSNENNEFIFDGPDGAYNGYILKCNAEGKVITAKAISGITNESTGLEITKDNNVIATGNFGGNIHFGGIVIEADGYYQEAYLAAYSETLICTSAFKIGSVYYDGMSALALDSKNNILCTGYFTETVDFDPSGEEALLYSPFPSEPGLYYDIFVAKYSLGDQINTEEIRSDNLILLSPNPALGSVRISYPESVGLRSVSLLNQYGEELDIKFSIDSQTIDMSGLPAGLYFVRMLTNSGVVIEKIIKL